ncbi:putative lipid-transfer protein DIR1 [Magnolia sinica]|uniref:putative lipid-transfer protein DIR1 n=1 Tax=Magnolia sinica TaxID=86752 RepID=UPI002657DE6A|nr:putative lipid-transfer protein DIR1 [Magnolia sinica]
MDCQTEEQDMERVPKLAIVALVLAAVIGAEVVAVSICQMSIADLQECKKALTGTPPPNPSPKCCGALSKADLTCLCNLKGSLSGYGIDPKLAMALPGKCGIPLPSKC